VAPGADSRGRLPHPLGEPVIPNGLALCKLHYAAFDSYIIGVTPVLEEIDFLAERYTLFRRASSAARSPVADLITARLRAVTTDPHVAPAAGAITGGVEENPAAVG